MKHFESYPLKFYPAEKEAIWGGEPLKEIFDIKKDGPVGEVWTLSSHPNHVSVCKNGPLKGKELTEITQAYPEYYLGETEQTDFPLLISFIYAAEPLSVQVHPDDAYAKKNENDVGKSEAWYIVKAEEEAKINHGHFFPSQEVFDEAVRKGEIEKHLRFIDISEDDFFFVPPGTVHTIMAGTFLIEVQQTSDITYRVYDWNRIGPDGKGRELHVEQAREVINFSEQPLENKRKIITKTDNFLQEQLIEDEAFIIEKWVVSGKIQQSTGKKGQPDLLICAGGKGVLSYRRGESISLSLGDTVLIPADLEQYEIIPKEPLTLLRTYYEK